ncbi:MAG: hypothetical protein PHE26_07050 [Syntrophomonadaceae bacterium]|nr:hypothetical protein [Syntrophomonadaceae bacterium]
MIKRNYNYIIMSIIGFLIIAGFIYLTSSNRPPEPQRKPPLTENEKKDTDKEAKWFVQFTVKNQKTTAYTEEVNAPRPSNGESYFIGGIAVHPRYPINAGGDPRIPILPYGTVIHLSQPISIQGQQYNSLRVMDTGDVNYGLWPDYPYWFDIYYGNTHYYSNKDARTYGTDTVDYTWFEEWK